LRKKGKEEDREKHKERQEVLISSSLGILLFITKEQKKRRRIFQFASFYSTFLNSTTNPIVLYPSSQEETNSSLQLDRFQIEYNSPL
jgi:hypothetical protein